MKFEEIIGDEKIELNFFEAREIAKKIQVMGVYTDNIGDHTRYDIEILAYSGYNKFGRYCILGLEVGNSILSELEDNFFDSMGVKITLLQLIASKSLEVEKIEY